MTVDADGAVIEVEIENTRIRGTVQLTKTDWDYPDNKLTGAEFTVYRDSNGNKDWMPTMNGSAHSPKPASAFMKWPICSTADILSRKRKRRMASAWMKRYYFEITEDGKTVIVENEAGKALSTRHRPAPCGLKRHPAMARWKVLLPRDGCQWL